MTDHNRALWRTQDIFSDDACWETAFAETQDKMAALCACAGTLREKDGLKRALTMMFALSRQTEALLVYAQLRRDEDKRVSLYQGMLSRAQTLQAQAEAAGTYIAPEILSLPEQWLEQALNDPDFAQYRVFLNDISRMRPHTLSRDEEKLLAMTGEVGEGAETIYEMLTDADIIFPEVENESGEKVRLTQAGYIPLMMSASRRVRRDAFQAYYTTLGMYTSTISAAYAASVKYDLFVTKARRYDSARQMSLFENHIPEKVYDNLLSCAEGHLGALSRYMNAAAKRLGLEKMTWMDVYAPAAEGFDLKLPYDEAARLMVECLEPLGADYQQIVRDAFENGWIDPFERPGKHSGAYSWGTYDSHPYVLMNYHENLESILTLAHEMGHAMHTYFSNGAQPYPTSGYSLFVAEVASTVNEVLVLLRLMQKYTGPEETAFLLNTLLGSYRSTLFRQSMFARFEMETHRMAQEGEALTSETLNGLYERIVRMYYPSVEPCEEIKLEWMRIPHFYSAFYVYVYATGFSAATAIARGLFEKKPGAREGYRAFLSAGSSVPPIEALKLAGVDMENPSSIEGALELFDALVERYETL